MSTPRLPRVSTGAAFAALIALIGGLTLNGLWQLRTLGEHMRTVVEHHNRKIDLITQTQVAAHVRTDSLFHMALEPDPFERDTHFLAFNRAGFQVGSGRKALRELGFSRDEQAYFEAQTRLVEHIQAQQENVIDLLMAERRAEAHKMLVTRVIPIQDRFNAQLADMRALSRGQPCRAVASAGQLPADPAAHARAGIGCRVAGTGHCLAHPTPDPAVSRTDPRPVERTGAVARCPAGRGDPRPAHRSCQSPPFLRPSATGHPARPALWRPPGAALCRCRPFQDHQRRAWPPCG